MSEGLRPCPYQTPNPPDNGTGCKDRYFDECQCWNTELVTSQIMSCTICGSTDLDVTFDTCRIRYDVRCRRCGYTRKARWVGPVHHWVNDWNHRPVEDALRAEPDTANVRIRELERERKHKILVDVYEYSRLTASYDQAHSAGANLGFTNARKEYEPILTSKDERIQTLLSCIRNNSNGCPPPINGKRPFCRTERGYDGSGGHSDLCARTMNECWTEWEDLLFQSASARLAEVRGEGKV